MSHNTPLDFSAFRSADGAIDEKALLFHFLSYATTQEKACAHAQALLSRIGKLSAILATPVPMLMETADLSEKEAALLSLLLPLRRRAWEESDRHTLFNRADIIGRYFVRLFAGFTTERVYLMALDKSKKLIRTVCVCDGSVNAASFQNRSIVEKAFAEGAAYAVLAHNHPGGELIPSDADIGTTASLLEGFDTMGIPLLEHILVAQNSYIPMILYTPSLLSTAPASFYTEAQLQQAKSRTLFADI